MRHSKKAKLETCGMKQTGLIDPVSVAKETIQAGLLRVGEETVRYYTDHPFANIRTPEEAGIAKIRPTPPAPSSKLLLRKKREVGNPKRWVVTKKTRPDLYQ